ALLRPPPHTLPRSGPFRHDGCDRDNDWECVPVRFVATCRNGHLEDFPWSDFVHAGKACGRPLTLREGATGELGEIVVACACGAAARAVESVLDAIDGATSAQDLAVFRKNRRVAKALEGLSDDEVLRVLQQLASGESKPVEGLRTAEFRQFIAQPVEQREVP